MRENETLYHHSLEEKLALSDSIRAYLKDEYGNENLYRIRMTDFGPSYITVTKEGTMLDPVNLTGQQMMYICLNYYKKRLKYGCL